jgi:hypothetical protein
MLQPAVCGNDKCDAGEDTQDCFKDCIDGWTKGVDGWSLAADGVLHGTGNIRALYTDYAFDIDADTDYTLSFYLKGGYCTVSIGLDDNCMTSTWNVEDCGLSQGSTISASTDSNNKDYSYNEKIFSIPSGSKSVNRQYKGVRVKISLSNCGGGGADIQNISLLSSKYVTDEAHYDAMPSSAEVSSCCPNNYCWNGTECVDSALWMKNSSMPPVWNTMLSSSLC